MPDALELLQTRRSLKPIELIGPGPSAAEIETLLTVASRVPDHGKLTPWRFIVFEGEARLTAGQAIETAFRAKYPDAKPDQLDYERKRLARAPLVIAVVSRAAPHVKIPEWEQVLSAGAAAMSLVLAAHALGYGANWITEWYAYDRRAGLELRLAFEHDETPGRELAVIGHARRDRQQRIEIGRRRAGADKLDRLERAAGPQQRDGGREGLHEWSHRLAQAWLAHRVGADKGPVSDPCGIAS